MTGDDATPPKIKYGDVAIKALDCFKELSIHVIDSEKNTQAGQVNIITVIGFSIVCIILSVGQLINDKITIPIFIYGLFFLGMISCMVSSRASTNAKMDSLK